MRLYLPNFLDAFGVAFDKTTRSPAIHETPHFLKRFYLAILNKNLNFIFMKKLIVRTLLINSFIYTKECGGGATFQCAESNLCLFN